MNVIYHISSFRNFSLVSFFYNSLSLKTYWGRNTLFSSIWTTPTTEKMQQFLSPSTLCCFCESSTWRMNTEQCKSRLDPRCNPQLSYSRDWAILYEFLKNIHKGRILNKCTALFLKNRTSLPSKAGDRTEDSLKEQPAQRHMLHV